MFGCVAELDVPLTVEHGFHQLVQPRLILLLYCSNPCSVRSFSLGLQRNQQLQKTQILQSITSSVS